MHAIKSGRYSYSAPAPSVPVKSVSVKAGRKLVLPGAIATLQILSIGCLAGLCGFTGSLLLAQLCQQASVL